jgi:hypothetical protein
MDLNIWITIIEKTQTQELQDATNSYADKFSFEQTIVLPNAVYAKGFRFVMS